MQDRFKFRAWLHSEGLTPKMVYDIEKMDNFRTWIAQEDKDPVMQCTGLRDKNGKLIFEGDIVAHINSGCFATIEYLSSSYSLMAHIRRMDDFVPIEEICYTEAEGTPFEVIGNIYENPELLEENNVNIQP